MRSSKVIERGKAEHILLSSFEKKEGSMYTYVCIKLTRCFKYFFIRRVDVT